MEEIQIGGLILITVTLLFSFLGFTDKFYFLKYNFSIHKILIDKEYKRIFTSGFLHPNWTQLIVNMLTLYFFSQPIEKLLGTIALFFIYLGSLWGGNILSLWIHKNNKNFSISGSMGAVGGVLFAALSIIPDYHIEYPAMSINIPGLVYGLAFGIFCLVNLTNKNQSGQGSQLIAGVLGLLITILIEPSILIDHYISIMLVIIPSIIFFYILCYKPTPTDTSEFDEYYRTMEEKYHHNKKLKEQELDFILEKIHSKGMNSLSKSEKEKLKKLSQEIR
jgi:membrane associated rhomboid family serine protease